MCEALTKNTLPSAKKLSRFWKTKASFAGFGAFDSNFHGTANIFTINFWCVFTSKNSLPSPSLYIPALCVDCPKLFLCIMHQKTFCGVSTPDANSSPLSNLLPRVVIAQHASSWAFPLTPCLLCEAGCDFSQRLPWGQCSTRSAPLQQRTCSQRCDKFIKVSCSECPGQEGLDKHSYSQWDVNTVIWVFSTLSSLFFPLFPVLLPWAVPQIRRIKRAASLVVKAKGEV